MRIIFMGTPEFAVPSLEHLMFTHHQVVAVYTQPDKPSGRGRALLSSPVKGAALAWKLPVVQPNSLKGTEVVEQLTSFHPDVIVVAAFGQILPQSVLDTPKYGCINIHPSLLPKFRGASPVAAAILAGDEFTGVSIMLMEMGLDTGPVLARTQIPVSPQDTTGSLTIKLSHIAARLLQEVLVGWFRDELTPQPQNEAEVTYSGLITKEAGETRTKLGDSLSENPFTYIARTLIVSIGAKAIFETLGVDPLTVKWREQILLEGTLIQMFEQACQFGIKLDEIKEGTSYRA